MFTIPKEMIDSVLKNLNPTTRQRHPSQSKGQGHSHSQGQRSNSDKGQPRSQPLKGSLNREIMYNQEPDYVAPISGVPLSSRNQALEGGRRGYNYVDSTNRNSGSDRSALDSNSVVRDVYGLKEGDVKESINKLTDENGNIVYDPSPNSIPDSEYQQPGLNQRQYGGSNNVQYPTYGNVDSGLGSNNAGYNIYGNVDNGLSNTYGKMEPRKPLLTVPNTIDEVNFHWVIYGFTNCTEPCGGGE